MKQLINELPPPEITVLRTKTGYMIVLDDMENDITVYNRERNNRLTPMRKGRRRARPLPEGDLEGKPSIRLPRRGHLRLAINNEGS